MINSLCLPREIVEAPDALGDVQDDVALAAGSNAPVLVIGPSSAHNEDIARLIHQSGTRADAPFVRIDCAGLSDQALECQLFGFRHGNAAVPVALAGGLVRRPPSGTVLLSSVHALSPRIQGLLFNWLRAAELRRSSDLQVPPDQVRLISETTEALSATLGSSRFRADLYYRLNQICISAGQPQ